MSSYYQYTGGGRSILDVAISPTWGQGRIGSPRLGPDGSALEAPPRAEGSIAQHSSGRIGAVLATTLVIVPMFAPYNQVLLVPCVMLIAERAPHVWKANRMSRFFVLLTATAIAWPVASALALALVWLFLPIQCSRRGGCPWDRP